MERFLEKVKFVGLFCVKWRYLIALIVFVFCVIFQIHGSSIAEYNNLFEKTVEYNEESIIAGKSRTIRGDEWAVSTPYFMSQEYNSFNKKSNMMSLDGQDMGIASNSPVLDVTILSKPFTWGYVLLGNDYGLSWYWCMKVILFILMSFEFCMVITKKNKLVSVFGALLIAFAPPIQWWFGIIDIFLFGMILFLIGYYFLTTKKRWQKNVLAVLTPFAAMAFILPLYPALIIPLGMFYFAMLVAVLVRDKKIITFNKVDIWRIAGALVGFSGVFAYFVISSWDGISAIMSTSYPGRRVLLGGDSEMKDLFTNMTTFALPYKDITYSNNSEMSTFIQFAPIFLMLYPVIYKKMKRNNNIIVGNVLVGCIVFVAIYMFIGFPELLAKLTMFSMVNRISLTYGFIATIFTIWGISMIWKKKLFTTKQIIVVLLICSFLYVCFVGENELSYYGWKYYIAIIAGIAVLGYLMLANYKKLFLAGMTIVIIATGFTVNPIARGVEPLTRHPLEQEINKIAEKDPNAYWLALDNNFLASIGVANGARVLNMVNFYPDYGKWELIDPERKSDEIYNRYAHINISLTDGETTLGPGVWADAIVVNLSCGDVDKWNVKYLITAGSIKACNDSFRNIYSDAEGEYLIYQRNDGEV
ncbi:hypothetical protein IKF21_01180 [Candidatus Saccharibacteria bacterium]|nr:hypothetical protein [Candidatus Saccharibacteria bacterium]